MVGRCCPGRARSFGSIHGGAGVGQGEWSDFWRWKIFLDSTAVVPLGLGMNDANQESDMADGSIRLHVVSKNLQSIRTEARFNDFLVETVSCDFDGFFSCQKHGGMQRRSRTQRLGGTGCTSVVALLIKELG